MYKENRPLPTKSIIRLVTMLVVAVFVVGLAAPHALAQSSARVRVLIAFTQNHGKQ